MSPADFARRAATVAERQALFRKERPPDRRGSRQIAGVVASSLTPAVAALWQVSQWRPQLLLVALAGLLLGTTIVYFGHRYPMHRRWRRATFVYDLHTGFHHMMFNEGQTEIASIDDVDMIMFPAPKALGLCAVLVPLLAAPWLWVGFDAALVFASVSWLYYLAYELVHLAAHGRIGGPLDHVPGLGWLLRHHRRHHAWPLMHHGNFSMLIPLWDWVLGTLLPPRGSLRRSTPHRRR